MSNLIAHYLAGGEGGTTIQYSEDGMDWYNCTNAFDTKCNKIVSLPETGFCVAAGEDTGGKSIKYSDDGKTWIDSNINETNIKDIFIDIRASKIWIAVSSNGNFYLSTDGKKWTSPNITSPPITGFSGIKFSYISKEGSWGSGTRLFVVGSGNNIILEVGIMADDEIQLYDQLYDTFDGDFVSSDMANLNIDQSDNIINLRELKIYGKILACGDNPKFLDKTTSLFQIIPDLKTTLTADGETGIFSAGQVNDKIFIGSDKNIYVMDSDLKFVTKINYNGDTVNEKYILYDSAKINSLTYDLSNNLTFAGITINGVSIAGSIASIQYYSDTYKTFTYVSSGGFTTACYTLTTRTAPQSEIDKAAKKPDVDIKNTSNNNTSTFKPTATSTPSKSDTPSIPPPVKTVSNKTQRPPPIEMLPAPKKSSGRSVKVHHTKIL